MFVVREIKTAVGVRLIERAKMHRGGSSWSQQCPSSKPYRFGLPLTGTKSVPVYPEIDSRRRCFA